MVVILQITFLQCLAVYDFLGFLQRLWRVTLIPGERLTDEETEVLLLGPSAAKDPDYA